MSWSSKVYLLIKKLTFALICFTFFSSVTPVSAQKKIILATGSEEGTYFPIGLGIKESVENRNSDIEVIVLSTEGSVENTKLLEADACQFAIIQSDIAQYFSKGERIFRFPSDKVKGVASLYTEPIQIVARKELGLERIQDLKGKRVAVGPKNSGTEFNSSIIISAYGIDYSDIDECYLSFTEAKDSLLRGKIDVVFMTAGLPTPALSEIASDITFISIRPDVIRHIRETYPYFVATTIPSNTYLGQFQEISTVGIRALFVARKDISPILVRKFTEAIFEEQEILERFHPIASSIELKSSKVGMTIPLHSGAEGYYIEKGLLKRNLLKHYYPILTVILLVLISGIVVRHFQHSILKILRRRIWVRLFVILSASYLVLTLGIFLAERAVNENFSNFFDSIWSTVMYLLSGLENRGPITNSGKVISTFIFLVGIIFLGSVAGEFASFFIKNKEVKMPKDIDRHIIICNWNSGGDRIIKELHASESVPETEILVITQSEVNEEELSTAKEYKKVYFIKGDPTLSDVLRSARVHLTRSVIILANPDASDPDAESVLIALVISKLTQKIEQKPHIVAEAINHRKIEHLKNAGVDEIICATDFGLGIIAQAAVYSKLTDIYQELLSHSSGNEFYIIEDKSVSEAICGKKFEDVAKAFPNFRNTDNPVILVGLKRDNSIILNPRTSPKSEEKSVTFKEGDALIVMSFSKPSGSNIIKMLEEI